MGDLNCKCYKDYKEDEISLNESVDKASARHRPLKSARRVSVNTEIIESVQAAF